MRGTAEQNQRTTEGGVGGPRKQELDMSQGGGGGKGKRTLLGDKTQLERK